MALFGGAAEETRLAEIDHPGQRTDDASARIAEWRRQGDGQ